MKDIVKILPNYKKFNSYIEDVKNGVTPIMLSGLTDSGKVHFAYSSFFYSEKPICIITYNELQAKKIIKNLEYFTDKINFLVTMVDKTYQINSLDTSMKNILCIQLTEDKRK